MCITSTTTTSLIYIHSNIVMTAICIAHFYSTQLRSSTPASYKVRARLCRLRSLRCGTISCAYICAYIRIRTYARSSERSVAAARAADNSSANELPAGRPAATFARARIFPRWVRYTTMTTHITGNGGYLDIGDGIHTESR